MTSYKWNFWNYGICQDILKGQCPRGLLAKNEHFGANCLWDRSPVILTKLHTNPSKFFLGRPKENLGVQTVGSGGKYKKIWKVEGELALVFTSHRSPLSERLRDQAKNRMSFFKTDPLLEDFSLDKRNQELLLKTCKKNKLASLNSPNSAQKLF